MPIFEYDERALNYLRSKDRRLSIAIDAIGIIKRETNPDLFSALVHSIVGQQISRKALMTVWMRIITEYGGIVTASELASSSPERLRACGLTFRKANSIQNIASKVDRGELNIAALSFMSDTEISAELCKLPGVGIWTAEMLLMFSLQRQDILSYGDLGIHKGLRMLYHHKVINRSLFTK